MNAWKRVTFSEVIKSLGENDRVKFAIKNLGYLPSVFLYGLEIIFLLKLSQIILGWRF